MEAGKRGTQRQSFSRAYWILLIAMAIGMAGNVVRYYFQSRFADMGLGYFFLGIVSLLLGVLGLYCFYRIAFRYDGLSFLLASAVFWLAYILQGADYCIILWMRHQVSFWVVFQHFVSKPLVAIGMIGGISRLLLWVTRQREGIAFTLFVLIKYLKDLSYCWELSQRPYLPDNPAKEIFICQTVTFLLLIGIYWLQYGLYRRKQNNMPALNLGELPPSTIP